MSASSQLRVEVDVFSGRSNPSWQLTDEEASELSDLVRRLSLGDRQKPAALGFRGFLVSRIEENEHAVRWLNVSSGSVRVNERNRTASYRDTEGVEAWLRKQAIAHGFGALIADATR